MSCEILGFVKTFCYFRFLTRATTTEVCDIAARGWLLLGASLQGVRVGRLEGIAVDWGEEVPVCELEVIGLIRCDSVNQISEVLWRRTVTSGGAHLGGLALQIRTIADFLFSLSLWISWVLLSLGELVISSF